MIIEQAMCLALNVYFETRSQGLAEMIAVSEVVMNRVESPRYPDTICEVVKQGVHWKGHPVRNKCQFSWYCNGEPDIPTNKKAWAVSQEVAWGVLDGRMRGVVHDATHYHAYYVSPSWAKTRPLVAKVGAHLFYK